MIIKKLTISLILLILSVQNGYSKPIVYYFSGQRYVSVRDYNKQVDKVNKEIDKNKLFKDGLKICNKDNTICVDTINKLKNKNCPTPYFTIAKISGITFSVGFVTGSYFFYRLFRK